MRAAARVGWCPGALRPMRSGDGLLVRVKPKGGILNLDQAAGLATLAARCGNGQLDLTGRANLQIRGVSTMSLGALQEGLGALGLLDADPAVEATRNIVASPLAGLDPSAAADIGPVMTALNVWLAADPHARHLPAKWSMVVDDGGALGLHDVAADVRLVFDQGGRLWLGLGDVWAVVPAGAMLTALAGLARVVADRRPARMRDLVDAVGADALFAAAGLAAITGRPSARPAIAAGDVLGVRGEGLFVGVAAPFGGLCWDDLAALVDAARRAGAHDLRLTPWRAILVTFPVIATSGATRRSIGLGDMSDAAGIAVAAAPPRNDGGEPGAIRRRAGPEMPAQLAHDLGALGLIVDGSDPRLALTACTGAPGCHRGTTQTRKDAAALAALIGRGPAMHVSGCAKGCARSAATPWTLVGRAGCYDLVRDGAAGDRPIAEGLSFSAAAAWIRGAMRADAPPGIL